MYYLKTDIERGSMSYKFSKKRNRFETCNQNYTFDPSTGNSTSYGSGYMISRLFKKGKNSYLILNSYHYSRTTGKHVNYTRQLLDTHCIVPYIVLEDSYGLRDLNVLLDSYTNKIDDLLKQFNQPKIRKKTKERIVSNIKYCAEIVQKLKKII